MGRAIFKSPRLQTPDDKLAATLGIPPQFTAPLFHIHTHAEPKMIRTQPLRSSRLAFASLPPQHSIPLWRPFSASSRSNNAQAPARSSPKDTKRKPFDIDAQWLPNTKREIGRCLDFGLKPKEITEAGELLQEISRDWRELKAGSEGYLTDVARRGLFQQSVAWGEMVRFRN